MRYRLMATYRGVPYEAGVGPTNADVVLFAACPPPEELGFEPATGHWRKELRIEDVQALWESRPMGTFRGDRCMVLDDLGDRLHIAYLGHDAYQAEQLGYWQVDRGVFELITPRDEVTEIIEERLDYLRPGGAGLRGTAPHAAVPPVTGPHAAVPPVTGPHAAVPPVTGPHAAVPPVTGPHAAAPAAAGAATPRDLVVIPGGGEPPLPLEAEARRAASARVMQPVFSELASLAAIPPAAYALNEEVDGAMCLIQTADGFEVFNAAAGARHEVRIFDDEESAYFYLFGVLAAEAIRTGRLAPQG
jgi:hypothetical protein